MPGMEMANVLSRTPCVVGTVHSPGSLAAAARLRPGAVDFLEIRVDAFASDPERLLERVSKLAFPLIITVRHKAEGGACSMPSRRRLALYRNFLTHAALIDVELRFVRQMRPLLDDAHAGKIGVILSHHNFQTTPPLAKLRALSASAAAAGADIFKVATTANTYRDVRVLIEFLETVKKSPLSVMGMGPLGKVSRLLLAGAGSVLNYAYLDKSQLPGQWPAKLLKERLAEL